MSIDNFVYSCDKQILLRSQVADRLSEKGWIVVFVDQNDETRVLPEGEIRHDLLLAARSGETADRMRELLRRKDEAGLDELYGRDALASCAVAATEAHDVLEYYPEAELEEMARSLGQEAGQVLRTAVTHYEIHTSSHRSRPSYKFQDDVWEVVGVLAGGLMEDPQTGSYYLCKDGEKKMIETSHEPETDPSDLLSSLTRFVDEAGRRGFPVKGRGGQAEVVTDELDLNRMEELLKLADDCVPIDPAFSLRETLLEEYVSNKGASFETEHRGWIESMKKTAVPVRPGATGLWGVLGRLFGKASRRIERPE